MHSARSRSAMVSIGTPVCVCVALQNPIARTSWSKLSLSRLSPMCFMNPTNFLTRPSAATVGDDIAHASSFIATFVPGVMTKPSSVSVIVRLKNLMLLPTPFSCSCEIENFCCISFKKTSSQNDFKPTSQVNVNGTLLRATSGLAALRAGCSFYGLSSSGSKSKCFERNQWLLRCLLSLTRTRSLDRSFANWCPSCLASSQVWSPRKHRRKPCWFSTHNQLWLLLQEVWWATWTRRWSKHHHSFDCGGQPYKFCDMHSTGKEGAIGSCQPWNYQVRPNAWILRGDFALRQRTSILQKNPAYKADNGS